MLKRIVAHAAGLLVFLSVVGAYLDSTEVTVTTLYFSFLMASFAGIALIAILVGPQLSKKERWGFGLLAAFSWRITYFPFMVFTGTFATFVEWAQVQLSGRSLFIYPSFLIGFAGLHALATLACALPFGRWRRWSLLTVPMILQALMISFTAPSDLTLLPDDTWRLRQELPELTLPRSNPYLTALEDTERNTWQKLLPFAAGSTYSMIPHTPWGQVVKGVLEAEYLRQPRASSHRRVEEHYFGYLLAHPFIGARATPR